MPAPPSRRAPGQTLTFPSLAGCSPTTWTGSGTATWLGTGTATRLGTGTATGLGTGAIGAVLTLWSRRAVWTLYLQQPFHLMYMYLDKDRNRSLITFFTKTLSSSLESVLQTGNTYILYKDRNRARKRFIWPLQYNTNPLQQGQK